MLLPKKLGPGLSLFFLAEERLPTVSRRSSAIGRFCLECIWTGKKSFFTWRRGVSTIPEMDTKSSTASGAMTGNHLAFNHFCEHCIPGFQFIRPAAFRDNAFIQYHNFIGIGHGSHPVGNNQNGLILDQP